MAQIVYPSEPTTRLVVLTRSRRHQSDDSISIPATQPAGETISLEKLQVNRLLDVAAEFAVAATRATGAAIGLLDDTGLYCRASSGDAPEKGVAIRIENTLSGECIRSGQIVRSDKAAGGGLPARSILLLPIHQHAAVAGIIGLFWREPHTLDESKIAIARAVAVAISATLDPSCITVETGEPASNAANTAAAPKSSESPLRSGKRKRFLRPPCDQCGAYYYIDEPNCPVCTAPLE